MQASISRSRDEGKIQNVASTGREGTPRGLEGDAAMISSWTRKTPGKANRTANRSISTAVREAISNLTEVRTIAREDKVVRRINERDTLASSGCTDLASAFALGQWRME